MIALQFYSRAFCLCSAYMFFSGCCVFPSAPWDWSPALRIDAIRFLHYPRNEMDVVVLSLVIKPSPAASPYPLAATTHPPIPKAPPTTLL